MKNTPVYRILSALSAAERRAFEKFVASPYCVSHPGVRALYERLRPYLSEAAGEPPDKKTLAQQLGIPVQRLYHLTSYLLDAVERFLAIETWSRRPHERNLLVAKALRHMKLDDLSASMLQYARKQLEADPYRGAAYHYADFSLHWEAFHLSKQQGRARTFNLQELSQAQDVAFICEKLRTGCLLLSHETVSRHNYDKGLLLPLLEYLREHPHLHLPLIAAYYHGYFAQLGGPGSDEHFRQLKRVLEQHAYQFSVDEVHDLYLMAINYCIRCINQSNEAYYADVFDLYQSGLRQGALLEDGVLSRWTYSNIATTALRLGAFDWAFQFLHEYAAFVPEPHREGALSFNLARYHYEVGTYSEAMRYLSRMDYDDVLQNLAAKVLLCKIYYEIGEDDALESQLNSIEIYLRRKKVLGYHKDNYSAIVRLMRHLVQTRNTPRAERRSALLQEIKQAPFLTEREWFLKKITDT